MSSKHISNHYLQASIRGAIDLGVSRDELLARARISPLIVDRAECRISEAQLVRLIKTVWKLTADEFMGLSSQRCNNGVFALMAESVLHAQNLAGVLRQSIRFYKAVRDDLVVEFRQYDEFTDITVSLKDQSRDSDHLLQEFLLLMWQRFCSWLVNQQLPIVSTWFNYPAPPHVDEYRQMFSGQLQFEQQYSGFTLNKKLLSLPVVREKHELEQFLADSPAEILHRLRHDDSCSTQVRHLLIQYGLETLPSLKDVAKEMHLTTRTLSRRLKEEGSSFQQIKDDLRHDTAVKLLADGLLSMAEISRLTGFTEQAAFCRAFKSWTGKAPTAYRRD